MFNRRTLLMTFIVILFSVGIGLAQQGEFGVAAVSGPDGVLLMLGGEILSKSTASQNNNWVGCNIYRKEDGKDKFKKINDDVVTGPNSLAELEKSLGDEFELLMGISRIERKSEFWDLIQNGDEKVLVLAMLDPIFRKSLGLSYLDTEVKRGIGYSYAITRVDNSGKESEYSDTSSVVFGVPPFEMKGPLNVNGYVSDKKIKIAWQVNSSDSAAFSYSIYRANKPEGPFTRLNSRPLMMFYSEESQDAPGGAFIDSTVRNGQLYYYAVVSVDIAGNESAKRPLLTLCPKDNVPPVVPQNIVALTSTKGIKLTWQVFHEEDLAGFIIYRSRIADSLYTRLTEAMIPPDTGYWEDETAMPNTQYYYHITAVDMSGNESDPSATALSLFENKRPPMPPNILRADGTPDGVRIEWQANTESDLCGYYLFRADGLNYSPVQVSPLIGKDTTFYVDTDSHLSPKGSYLYYLKSVNYTGVTSSLSAPIVAVPGIVIPPEPPLSFYGYQDIMGNRLFWTPTSDNSAAGYFIYRTVESDSAGWKKLNSTLLPYEANNFTDSSAELNVAYRYHIKAIDSRGNEGKSSHSISLSKFSPPPLPPGNVTVTQADNGLKIAWDITREPRVNGYRVYRRADKGPATVLNENIIPVATGEFRDSTSKAGTRYFYSISCVGSDGREGAKSGETTYLAR